MDCSKNKTVELLRTVLRILLGAALVYAGKGHLTHAKQEFLAQVPSFIPFSPELVVLLSGIVEILLGLSLILLYKYKNKVGIVVAIFFILIFPGNISQYVNGIDAFGLDTDTKRAIRLVFQPLLVVWALWSTGNRILCKKRNKTKI